MEILQMCRACLSTDMTLIPFDEIVVNNYNLITHLNVTLNDDMPHFFCQNCLKAVNFLINFREKSILSETTLLNVIFSNEKVEDNSKDNKTNGNVIKTEIKIEEIVPDSPLQTCLDDPFMEMNLDYMIIKPEIEDISRKEKKSKRKKSMKLEKNAKNKKVKLEALLKSLCTYPCGLCAEYFEEEALFLNHLEIHKANKLCKLCSSNFLHPAQMLAHRISHLPRNNRVCHICKKNLKIHSTFSVEYHYRNKHYGEDKPLLTCSHCLKNYDSPTKLNKHMQKIHTCTDVQFTCDYCSKTLRSKKGLELHIRIHSTNKKYMCDECSFTCRYTNGLTEHKLRKHSLTKVYCKDCKRVFSTKEKHDKHRCNRPDVICPICGKQLKHDMRLNRHMESHSSVKKYKCHRCSASYKTKGALTVHLDRHDGNRTKQCEYCQAKFYNASVLIKHRRIHTGEKPYVCKVCNKGFTGNHNLKVHMKVHGEYLVVKKNKEPEDVNGIISPLSSLATSHSSQLGSGRS